MVNKQDIKKKEDAIADSAIYNGRKLTSAEKTIFDHDDIKNDLTKIRDTAEILEKVIKAKEESKKNTSLLNQLKGYKRSNPESVKAINEKNGSQFDLAITLLESFESGDKDEQTLKGQIEQIKTQEASVKARIDRNKEKRDRVMGDVAEAERKMVNYGRQKEELDITFRENLSGIQLITDASGKKTNRFSNTALGAGVGYFLSDGVTRVNQKLANIIDRYNKLITSTVNPILFDSKIRYSTPHRKSVHISSLRSAAFETFDMMRGDDFKAALFKYVDDNSLTIPAYLGGNKQGLKDK